MLKILITLIVILTITAICISYKLYNYALNPKASKKGIFNNSKKEKREEELWIYKKDKKEDVYINSFDNLKLHGLKIKNNESSKWAITVHGYTGKCENMSAIAYKYYTKGYNLLMIDLRGHGKSEGSYIGMGYHDRLDVLKWIDFILKKEDKNAQIVLHGVSMGAATVMMVSGEELPENVKAIVEDCGYTSAMKQLSYKLKEMFKMPQFPIMHLCSLITKIKGKYFLGEANSIKQLKKAKVPILFIHGDKDNFVPFYMLDEVYSACNSPKDKLIVKDASHANSEKVNNELYWNKVFNFINKYVK